MATIVSRYVDKAHGLLPLRGGGTCCLTGIEDIFQKVTGIRTIKPPTPSPSPQAYAMNCTWDEPLKFTNRKEEAMEQTLLNEIVARVAAKLAEAEGARPLRPPRPDDWEGLLLSQEMNDTCRAMLKCDEGAWTALPPVSRRVGFYGVIVLTGLTNEASCRGPGPVRHPIPVGRPGHPGGQAESTSTHRR